MVDVQVQKAVTSTGWCRIEVHYGRQLSVRERLEAGSLTSSSSTSAKPVVLFIFHFLFSIVSFLAVIIFAPAASRKALRCDFRCEKRRVYAAQGRKLQARSLGEKASHPGCLWLSLDPFLEPPRSRGTISASSSKVSSSTEMETKNTDLLVLKLGRYFEERASALDAPSSVLVSSAPEEGCQNPCLGYPCTVLRDKWQ